MEKKVNSTITEYEADKIIEALILVKKVHKYISQAPYHKDMMEYRVLKDAANWYKSFEEEEYAALVAKIIEVKQTLTAFNAEVETSKPEPSLPKEFDGVISAGEMHNVLYKLFQEREFHVVEIEVPEELETPLVSATLRFADKATKTIANTFDAISWFLTLKK